MHIFQSPNSGIKGPVISPQPACAVLYPPPLHACAYICTLTLLYILSHTALLSPFLDCHLVSFCSSIPSSMMPPPPFFPSHFLRWLCFSGGPKHCVDLFNPYFTHIAPPLEVGSELLNVGTSFHWFLTSLMHNKDYVLG